jgi:hypothetical protein
MKKESFYIVFVLSLCLSGCVSWQFPKVTQCTILEDGCICTSPSGEESFPEDKCVGYVAASPDDFNRTQQSVLDLEKEWRKYKLQCKPR